MGVGGTHLNKDGSLRQNVVSALIVSPFPESSAEFAL